MSNIHVLRTKNDYRPKGCGKLTIPDCRAIFEKHGYGLERDTVWGWNITHKVNGAMLCQEYYDPQSITLRSRGYSRRDIQAFAAMMREELT